MQHYTLSGLICPSLCPEPELGPRELTVWSCCPLLHVWSGGARALNYTLCPQGGDITGVAQGCWAYKPPYGLVKGPQF